MYKRAGIAIVIVSLITAMSVADEPPGQMPQAEKEIYFDQSQVEQTERTLEALSHAIDLWHDACLKGDTKLMAKYNEQLDKLIDTDIDHARSVVTRQQRQVAQTAMTIERRSGKRRWEEKINDRADLRQEKQDYHQAQNWLAVKKRLAASIAKTGAFSNRLRLFNTYTEALKRQLDSESFELAKDMRELEQDERRFVLEKQD